MAGRLIFLALLVSTLIGCGPVDSLNPILADKDIVFDKGLLGMWSVGGSAKDGYIQFDKAGDNGYRITMVDENGSDQQLDAHVGYIQGGRFLDVVPVLDTTKWSFLENSDLSVANPKANGLPSKPGLIKLDDAMYLQFAYSSSENNKVHFKLNVRAAHWFCKVGTEGSELHLDCLDGDWVSAHIDDPGVNLEHEFAGTDKNELVITASTGDLQGFVSRHADDAQAFAWSMTAKHLAQEK